jgi:hypothetical protein
MELGRQGGRQQGQPHQRIPGQEAPSPGGSATLIHDSHDTWLLSATTSQALCSLLMPGIECATQTWHIAPTKCSGSHNKQDSI